MTRVLARFTSLCSRREIFQLWMLLGLGLLIAVLEVAGVASVLPFLELASDPEALDSSHWLQFFYEFFGFDSPQAMLIAIAWLVLLLLTLSNTLAAVSIWFQQKTAWSLSHHISMKLVRTYTLLPYQFFLDKDSSELIRSLIDDINNLIEGVVLAGCRIVSQLLIAVLIFLLLIVVQPFVALVSVGLFATIYLVILLTRKTFLSDLGRESMRTTSERYRTFVDLISGIKVIKSNGAKNYFISRFEHPSWQFSEIHPIISFTASVPRYIVETIAFGSVVFVILYLSGTEGGFVGALPTLTLFTLAGYRLIPAIHGTYVSATQVLNSYPAIDSIYEDIHSVLEEQDQERQPISFNDSISLRHVSFSYSTIENPALDDVSLDIAKGSKVALVGPSGSGKTTLADLLMGLLSPSHGSILIDNTPLAATRLESWRELIGYVPQEIFLFNDTIANNIVFGFGQIDMGMVRRAAQMAQIGQFIEEHLDQGYETRIGERGVRLSGGQRQRLGLARALYRCPQVLVLDEATSALDTVTEGEVVRAIHEEIPDVTIIMIAHRISTVVRCDHLFAMDQGKVVAQGTYSELMKASELFRGLARFD